MHLFDPHAPYDAPAEYRSGRAPYDAEVAYADAMVGRLLERLRAGHALDHTAIIVTADHGESLGEHGETTHGLFAYGATLSVPLIVSGPGIGRGVIDGAVGHADLLPTICDLLGVAVPTGLDGISLIGPPAPDRLVYFEALDASLTRDWAPLTGVASARWKFIDLPEPELYDLAADAAESNNLAGRDSSQLKALAAAKDTLVSRAQQAAPAATTAAVDEQADRRLRSLGYVAASSSPSRKGAERTRSHSAADDPKRLVALNERFNTALSAFNNGHETEALAGFRSVLSERPDFLSARTSAATLLVARGRAGEAVALLRDAPPHQAGSPQLLAKLGVALREAGDLPSAAVSLERARAAGAENPELANDLGVVYARLGRANDARALFQELLGRDPDDAATWNNLGVLELSSGAPDAGGRGVSTRGRGRSGARRRLARARRRTGRAGSTGGDRRVAPGRAPAAARLRPAVQPGCGAGGESESARGAALSRAVRPRGAARPLRAPISRASRPCFAGCDSERSHRGGLCSDRL